MKTLLKQLVSRSIFVVASLCASNLVGSVIPIGLGDFPAGTTPITFTGLADGTEVNGLTVNGVLFNYLIGGIPTHGTVVIDAGPGVTNNITPPNIVALNSTVAILRMTLPFAVSEVGFGYATEDVGTFADEVTVSVYDGTSFLGSLSYTGMSDPFFTGGFAGLQSTSPFSRVDVAFNETRGATWALDNVVLAAVPEPSAAVMILSGAVLLYYCRKDLRHRRI
jgi:hypothetical protein